MPARDSASEPVPVAPSAAESARRLLRMALKGSLATLSGPSFAADVVRGLPTALTIATVAASGFPVNYYLRSADVTSFVKARKGGTYSVSGVPATQIGRAHV